MQKYRSHKIVEAAPLIGWYAPGSDSVAGGVILSGHETVKVPDDFFARGYPKPGDYLVRYEDGYLSWSPKAAFEAGYTALGETADAADIATVIQIIGKENGTVRDVAERIVEALKKPVGIGMRMPAAFVAGVKAGQTYVGSNGQNLTLVPTQAIDWLMGEDKDDKGRWYSEGEDQEAQRRDEQRGPRRPYWWRSVFSRMIRGSEVFPAQAEISDVSRGPKAPV